jgi:uncharacterized protein (TIGR03382 family)
VGWTAAAVVALVYLARLAMGRKDLLKVAPALLVATAVPLPFAPAFVLCAVGDFMLLDSRRFIGGLVGFLLAHLAFIAGFSGLPDAGVIPAPVLVGLLGTLAAGMVALLWPALDRGLRVAVPIYAAALATMAFGAARTGWVGALGGVIFVVSDAVLAYNRFRRPVPHAEPVVMTTYYAAILALGAAVGSAGPRALPVSLPPPTENRLDEDAEERANEGRKAWFEQLHRAPPDVDWRQVERENGLQQVRRRRRLALAPPSHDEAVPAWVERGSSNQAGRMHVARLTADQTQLYAGSSLGGVWRGWPDGSEWAPLADNLYGGAQWLEVLSPELEGDPDVMLVGTDGGLLHRSTDDGATWEVPEGADDLGTVRRMLMSSEGDQIVLVVAQLDSRYVLFRSADRGASFERVYSFGTSEGDIWMPRDGGSTLYMIDAGVLSTSADYGDTWAEVGDLGEGDVEYQLTGSEAGAPRLWAVAETSAGDVVYRSDDAGVTWSGVYTADDYWEELNASSIDADTFAYGGVNLHVTHDGGATFEEPNDWSEYYGDPENKLHADMMGLDVVWLGEGQETWFINCDGGIWRSADSLRTVQNLSLDGLRVSQYYSVLTSSADATHIAAGAQDQGYQVTLDHGEVEGVYAFEQAISGDYGHLTSPDGTHAWVIATYPGVLLADKAEDRARLFWMNYPRGETVYAWLPPLLAIPGTEADFFFGAESLWRYTFDGEAAWDAERWTAEDFVDEYYEFIGALAMSPLDSQRMWLATSYGDVFRSTDGGVTWAEPTADLPSANYYYGNALLPSGTDVDLVYLGGSGYDGPAVYRTTDGGETWEAWSDGLPYTLVYSLVEAPDGSGSVFAGTETSVYMREADGSAWVDVTTGAAPVTIYWSAEALTGENTVRFATYGRGIWDYQLDPEHTGCFPVQDWDADGADCESDCDDHDAARAPGNDDPCDGIDGDCDGTEEPDADGDGSFACVDCDDASAGVFPGAPEVCGDGVDQDCDGVDAVCEGDGAPVAGKPAPGGCGCAGGGPEAGALAGLALLALRRRRPRDIGD